MKNKRKEEMARKKLKEYIEGKYFKIVLLKFEYKINY